MRNALFATVFASGIAPFVFAGCSSNNGPTMANKNTSSDWFGVQKLAGLFKADAKPISAIEKSNPHDPTSLAFKGDPPGADLYVSMARVQERQNNVAAAEQQYQHAIKISETDLAALLGYAHLLDRQGRLDEAASLYEKAVEHHPNDASAHNDLGLCYARRGMLDESIAELSKAVELSPDKKLYRNNIATVFVEKGQPQRALEHLTVAEEPGVAHYNLACLLHQRGQSSAAAFHFAEAAKRNPTLAGAQQPSPSVASTSAPRMTGVRPVDQSASNRPHTQWPQTTAENASGAQAGADRNWSAYDVASASPTGTSSGSASRGSAYAMPPTPETAGNYSIPVSAAVDLLPPVEQAVPRY